MCECQSKERASAGRRTKNIAAFLQLSASEQTTSPKNKKATFSLKHFMVFYRISFLLLFVCGLFLGDAKTVFSSPPVLACMQHHRPKRGAPPRRKHTLIISTCTDTTENKQTHARTCTHCWLISPPHPSLPILPQHITTRRPYFKSSSHLQNKEVVLQQQRSIGVTLSACFLSSCPWCLPAHPCLCLFFSMRSYLMLSSTRAYFHLWGGKGKRGGRRKRGE